MAKHQFSEVLVFSYKQCGVLIRALEDFFVRDAGLHLCDVQNGMPILSEEVYNLLIDVLISEQNHATSSVTG